MMRIDFLELVKWVGGGLALIAIAVIVILASIPDMEGRD